MPKYNLRIGLGYLLWNQVRVKLDWAVELFKKKLIVDQI